MAHYNVDGVEVGTKWRAIENDNIIKIDSIHAGVAGTKTREFTVGTEFNVIDKRLVVGGNFGRDCRKLKPNLEWALDCIR